MLGSDDDRRRRDPGHPSPMIMTIGPPGRYEPDPGTEVQLASVHDPDSEWQAEFESKPAGGAGEPVALNH